MPHQKHTSHEKKHFSRPLIRKGAICIFGIIILIIFVFVAWAIAIYKYHVLGPKTQKLFQYIPYPVMIVQTEIVTFHDYYTEYAMFDYFMKTQGDTAQEEMNNVKKSIISKITKDAISRFIARQYMLPYTKEDINNKLNSIIDIEIDQRKVVKDVYGSTLEDFKKYYIEPLVIRDKMQEHLDKYANNQKKIFGRELIARVEGGFQSFEDVARENSNDISASTGGDIGWIKRGERFKELDDKIFNLEIGKMSKVFETRAGFHIFRISEKKEEKKSDGTLESFAKIQYIFLERKDPEDWINEVIGKYFIKNFIE